MLRSRKEPASSCAFRSDCQAWFTRPAPFAMRCWKALTAPSYSSWYLDARWAFTASWLTWAWESEEMRSSGAVSTAVTAAPP